MGFRFGNNYDLGEVRAYFDNICSLYLFQYDKDIKKNHYPTKVVVSFVLSVCQFKFEQISQFDIDKYQFFLGSG